MRITVRKARKSDIPGIIPIWIREFGKPPFREKWTPESARKKLLKYFRNRDIFVATAGGRIEGAIVTDIEYWYDGYHGFVDEIIVSEELQGHGIGSALMERAEKLFRSKGCIKFELFTSPAARAMKFYRKLGFRKAGYIMLEKKL